VYEQCINIIVTKITVMFPSAAN